ncbi:hypothetical protein Tco_0017222 [Tanacetum coccineum]
MANLEFCDTHNMVSYLHKTEGSEDFHQIVDFLNTSHIKYALTENPTIHVSLIQQFWQTAAANTLDSGEVQITATIDGKVKLVSEAPIRRHLKLEDSDGITTLPNTETTKDKSKALMQESEQPKKIKKRIQADEDLAQKLLEEVRKNLSIEERARLLAELINKRKKLQAAQRYKAIRNKPQTMSQQRKTMCTYMKNMAGYKMEHFKGKSFYEVKEMFDNVYKQVTSFVPMDSVMEKEITKRAGLNLQEERSKRQKTGEGSVPTKELKADEISQEDLQQMIMVVPVEEVYTELKQTKQTYGAALTKLIKKVKKLEQTVKTSQARRRAKIVSSQEDQSEDQLGVLSAAKVLADVAKKNVNTYTRRRITVSTGSEEVSTTSRIFSTAEESVSTAGVSMPVSTAGMVQQVNIIIPSSSETRKDKELAQKLHEEEQARFNAEQEAKFNAEQEELLASETTKDEANSLVTDIDWDDVQAQIQVDENLAQKLLDEERENLSIEERARLLAELIDKRKKLQAAQRYEAIRNKPQTIPA